MGTCLPEFIGTRTLWGKKPAFLSLYFSALIPFFGRKCFLAQKQESTFLQRKNAEVPEANVPGFYQLLLLGHNSPNAFLALRTPPTPPTVFPRGPLRGFTPTQESTQQQGSPSTEGANGCPSGCRRSDLGAPRHDSH